PDARRSGFRDVQSSGQFSAFQSLEESVVDDLTRRTIQTAEGVPDLRLDRLVLPGQSVVIVIPKGNQLLPELVVDFLLVYVAFAFGGGSSPFGFEYVDRKSHQPRDQRP